MLFAGETVVYTYANQALSNPAVNLFMEAALETVRHVVGDKERFMEWQGRVRFPGDRL